MSDNEQIETIDWVTELTENLNWISRVIYARVQDQHAVEDVVQELGVAAMQWPNRLTGASAVNRWLRAVAVRQSLLYRRTRQRERDKTRRFAEQMQATNRSSNDIDPLAHLIASENAQWVRSALTNLSARQRETLLLKHFESWSCRQIADKFGVAESTVQRHLVNARKRLRSELLRLRNENEIN